MLNTPHKIINIKIKPIIIFLALSLILYLGANTFKSQKPQNISSLLEEIKNSINSRSDSPFKFQNGTKNKFIWVSNDGWNVSVDNPPSISMKFIEPAVSGDTQRKELITYSKKIEPLVTKIFEQEGFQKNIPNSSVSQNNFGSNDTGTNGIFYDYRQAFQKGSISCLYVMNPDLSGNSSDTIFSTELSVSCTDQFAQNYAMQLPYLKAVNKKGVTVTVIKQNNEFALIDLYYGRTGDVMVLQKISNQWQPITGEGLGVSCYTVTKYHIPKSIVASCADPNGNFQDNLIN